MEEKDSIELSNISLVDNLNINEENYNIALNKNKKNNDLLAKIKEKVTKENLGTKIKQIKEKDEKLEKNIIVKYIYKSKDVNHNNIYFIRKKKKVSLILNTSFF